MIAALLKEKADEIKHKDFCTEGLNTNERETENKDFQGTVADQRATKELLNKALGVLKAVFAKKFLQVSSSKQPAGPPPPPGFKEYKQSSGAGGVMGMLE